MIKHARKFLFATIWSAGNALLWLAFRFLPKDDSPCPTGECAICDAKRPAPIGTVSTASTWFVTASTASATKWKVL